MERRSPNNRPPPWRPVDWLLLVALLSTTTVLRVTLADAFPSFDELWHLALTRGQGNGDRLFPENIPFRLSEDPTGLTGDVRPVFAIWNGMGGTLHPPGYILALRAWRELFGPTDFAARSLSLFSSWVLVAFTFFTGRIAMNRGAGTAAALLLAVGPTQIYFGQEIRAYAMVSAFGAIALWVMTRVEIYGPSRRRSVGLALLCLPLLLLHYFASGAVLGVVIYGLLRLKGSRLSFLATLLVVAGVYAVGWLPHAIDQLQDVAGGDAFNKLPEPDVQLPLKWALTAPIRLIADLDADTNPATALAALPILLPWFLLRRFRPLLPWALWMCSSVGVIAALDVARTTLLCGVIRYLAVATPAAPLLFLGVAWPWRHWASCVLGAALCVTAALCVRKPLQVLVDAPEHSSIVRAVERCIGPGEPLIVCYPKQREGWVPQAWLLACSHSPKLLDRNVLLARQPVPESLAEKLGGRTAWMLYDLGVADASACLPGATVGERIKLSRTLFLAHVTLPATPP